jgi:hypothetical protein
MYTPWAIPKELLPVTKILAKPSKKKKEAKK